MRFHECWDCQTGRAPKLFAPLAGPLWGTILSVRASRLVSSSRSPLPERTSGSGRSIRQREQRQWALSGPTHGHRPNSAHGTKQKGGLVRFIAGGREGARGVSAICSSANAGLQLAEQDLRRTIGPSFGVSAGADSLCCAARAIVVELSMIIAGAPGPMYAWHGADQVTKVGFLDCCSTKRVLA
jgi:hypothetical protein